MNINILLFLVYELKNMAGLKFASNFIAKQSNSHSAVLYTY